MMARRHTRLASSVSYLSDSRSLREANDWWRISAPLPDVASAREPSVADLDTVLSKVQHDNKACNKSHVKGGFYHEGIRLHLKLNIYSPDALQLRFGS
jgi:hypothetical protein